METAQALGCESVTVTGGGEPLLHKELSEFLTDICRMGIEIGLVTNGSLLSRFGGKTLHKLTWCRVSSSDNLKTQLQRIGMSMKDWFKILADACHHSSVDWAFSHVLTRNPNAALISEIIEFANDFNFTHVRIVSDLLDLDAVQDMTHLQEKMHQFGVDDRRVIYQGRKLYAKGQNPCYISLLKPVIGADGGIYPCCGTQYSLANPSRDYEPRMKMGMVDDLPDLIEKQRFFDGSICDRCYYQEYNNLLGLLLADIKHLNFV